MSVLDRALVRAYERRRLEQPGVSPLPANSPQVTDNVRAEAHSPATVLPSEAAPEATATTPLEIPASESSSPIAISSLEEIKPVDTPVEETTPEIEIVSTSKTPEIWSYSTEKALEDSVSLWLKSPPPLMVKPGVDYVEVPLPITPSPADSSAPEPPAATAITPPTKDSSPVPNRTPTYEVVVPPVPSPGGEEGARESVQTRSRIVEPVSRDSLLISPPPLPAARSWSDVLPHRQTFPSEAKSAPNVAESVPHPTKSSKEVLAPTGLPPSDFSKGEPPEKIWKSDHSAVALPPPGPSLPHERLVASPSEPISKPATEEVFRPTPISPATIPEAAQWSWPEICHRLLQLTGDGFIQLAKQLQQTAKKGQKCLAFVSPVRDTGRTSVVLTLSYVLAREGVSRVLVIDADYQHPHLATMVKVQPQLGLWDLLNGRATIAEVVIPMRPGRVSLLPGIGPVTTPEWSRGVPQLRHWLTWLQPEYDLILINAGVMTGAEPISECWLKGCADSVVTIARERRSHDHSPPPRYPNWSTIGITSLGVIETFA